MAVKPQAQRSRTSKAAATLSRSEAAVPAPTPESAVTTPAGVSIEDTASGKGIIVKDPGQRHAERIKRIPGTRASWRKQEQGWLMAKAKEGQIREALADLLVSEPHPPQSEPPTAKPQEAPHPSLARKRCCARP